MLDSQAKGANVVTAKWVYTWKTNEMGLVVNAISARPVARRLGQGEGVNLFRLLAPTTFVFGKLFVGCACVWSILDLCHFDAKQSFMQYDLEEDDFIRSSRGCGRMSANVVRLEQTLHGLRQASRSWHSHFITRMKSYDFEQCLADTCVMRLIEIQCTLRL